MTHSLEAVTDAAQLKTDWIRRIRLDVKALYPLKHILYFYMDME
jgi:hypothetical protein